ncbi:MAG: hypothetical protein U1D30_11285 [Planctomycetota bacterium]
MSDPASFPPANNPDDEEGLDSGFGEEMTFEIPPAERPDYRPAPPVGKSMPEASNPEGEEGLSSGFGNHGTVELPATSLPKSNSSPAGKSASRPTSGEGPSDTSATFMTVSTLPEMKAIPSVTANPTPAAKGRTMLIVLLFTWASVATILAVWFWMNQRSLLENLPDDGTLQGSIVSPLEWLSKREMVPLGATLCVGSLEVTPLRIENRPVAVLPDGFQSAPVLVMYLKVKNISKDQTFYPSDPAYLYPRPDKKLAGLPAFDRSGYTYTFLHPAGATDRLLPPFDLPFELGHGIAGQEFPSLKPGESAELIVISGEDAYQELKPNMVWRVKLRKGKSPDGKGIATVIGVPFQPQDVKKADIMPTAG